MACASLCELILLNMSGRGGLAFLEVLRQHESTRRTLAAMLSGGAWT